MDKDKPTEYKFIVDLTEKESFKEDSYLVLRKFKRYPS